MTELELGSCCEEPMDDSPWEDQDPNKDESDDSDVLDPTVCLKCGWIHGDDSCPLLPGGADMRDIDIFFALHPEAEISIVHNEDPNDDPWNHECEYWDAELEEWVPDPEDI